MNTFLICTVVALGLALAWALYYVRYYRLLAKDFLEELLQTFRDMRESEDREYGLSSLSSEGAEIDEPNQQEDR